MLSLSLFPICFVKCINQISTIQSLNWPIKKWNRRFCFCFLWKFFNLRFSDPCLAANSEDETQTDRDKSNTKNQSDHNKLIATLIKQINILHETNSKICRNLNDTKSEYTQTHDQWTHQCAQILIYVFVRFVRVICAIISVS